MMHETGNGPTLAGAAFAPAALFSVMKEALTSTTAAAAAAAAAAD